MRNALIGTGKKGHYERGLFTGGISRISRISKFSRISRKRSDSPLFSTVWRFSRISRISKFSRISRKWTFLTRPLFQKTPFSDPDLIYQQPNPEPRVFFLARCQVGGLVSQRRRFSLFSTFFKTANPEPQSLSTRPKIHLRK